MERLVVHPIFSLLDTSDSCVPSQNIEFSTSFKSFRSKLIRLSEKRTSLNQIYREIREAEAKILYLKNNNAQAHISNYEKSRILDKLLTIISIEKELIKMRLSFPQSFEEHEKSTEIKSNLKWSGSQCDLVELIIAIINSQVISTVDGKPLTQVTLIGMFEKFFNIRLKRPYDLKAEIFRRKKASTPFIDRLRTNVLQQIDNYYSK